MALIVRLSALALVLAHALAAAPARANPRMGGARPRRKSAA